jgi:ribosomal protein L37E
MKMCRRCGVESRPYHASYCEPCRVIRRAETRVAYKAKGSTTEDTFFVNRTEALVALMKAMAENCPGPVANASTFSLNSHGNRVVKELPTEDCSTCFFTRADYVSGECPRSIATSRPKMV